MNIGRLNIKASRWPWQKQKMHWSMDQRQENYGWFHKSPMGRFGGGWNYKLGFALASRTLMLDLLFGIVTISWKKK